MDQATAQETARIEELLSAYRGLQAQFEIVRERLRRAEDNRHSVARRIYDRVRADYDRELDAIRARLTPLRDELDHVHEALEAQCRDAVSALHAVEEELAESEFRHRIGEYADDTYADMHRALDVRAEDARARQASLQAALDAIAAQRNPAMDSGADNHSSEAPVSVDTADMSPREPAATPEVYTDAGGDETHSIVIDEPPTLRAGRADEFENPQQWVRDVASGPSRVERRVHLNAMVTGAPAKPSVADEIDSVLAPLDAPAAPSPSFQRAATSTTSTAPASGALPSLVFVSGPHTGQAIPLLPTTLTIGREHDNNVEIKDPEVARYHARVLRERDDFVVEDLNSSTGTWVNGERKVRAVLSHGDVIRVGQTEVAIDFEWTTDSR